MLLDYDMAGAFERNFLPFSEVNSLVKYHQDVEKPFNIGLNIFS